MHPISHCQQKKASTGHNVAGGYADVKSLLGQDNQLFLFLFFFIFYFYFIFIFVIRLCAGSSGRYIAVIFICSTWLDAIVANC